MTLRSLPANTIRLNWVIMITWGTFRPAGRSGKFSFQMLKLAEKWSPAGSDGSPGNLLKFVQSHEQSLNFSPKYAHNCSLRIRKVRQMLTILTQASQITWASRLLGHTWFRQAGNLLDIMDCPLHQWTAFQGFTALRQDSFVSHIMRTTQWS